MIIPSIDGHFEYYYHWIYTYCAGLRSSSIRPTDYAFTGQIRDNYSCLQYHRARWLNPHIGNWVSADESFDFPENFGHSTSYVGSSPIDQLDPAGQLTLTELVSAITIVNIIAVPAMKSMLSGGTSRDAAGAALGGVMDMIKGLLALGPLIVSMIKDPMLIPQIMYAMLTGFFSYIVEFLHLIRTAWNTLDGIIRIAVVVVLIIMLAAEVFSALESGAKFASNLDDVAIAGKTSVKSEVDELGEIAAKSSDDAVRRVSVFKQEKVQYTAPHGTKQTYDVVQRTDINWDRRRTREPVGVTNKQAAKDGYTPELDDGNIVNLHHVNQDARGPLVEVTTRIHKRGQPGYDALHNLWGGPNNKNPNHPVDRPLFDADRSDYWVWRAQQLP